MAASNTARSTARKTLRPADDQPFDFNLDTVEAESDLRPFRVHHGGRRWQLAHMQAINIWDLLFEEDTQEQAALRIFEAALGDQWAEFRKVPLPMHKVRNLFAEYQKHCGVELGESSASTAS